MKVRYLGPRQSVDVAGHGTHAAGEVKDYPEKTARELIATSRRQRFEAVTAPPPAKAPAKGAPSRSKGKKRSPSHEKK